MSDVTRVLLEDGLRLFSESFDSLLGSLGRARQLAGAGAE